jgi:hypothetical protein
LGLSPDPALIQSTKIDAVYAVVSGVVRSVTLEPAAGKTIDVPVQDGGYHVEVPTSDASQTRSPTTGRTAPSASRSQSRRLHRGADRKLTETAGVLSATTVSVPGLLSNECGDRPRAQLVIPTLAQVTERL